MKEWAQARDSLREAVTGLGYPPDLADLLAREIGSSKGIDRLTAYIDHARPATLGMLVDEMLAIKAQIETWREKKESQAAQTGYNAYLFHRRSTPEDE